MRADILTTKLTPGDNRPIANCKGIDLSHLPPCRSSLIKHFQRANFQAMIWKQADCHYQNLPNTELQLVVDWNDGDIFPRELVDIITKKKGNIDSDIIDIIDNDNDKNDVAHVNGVDEDNASHGGHNDGGGGDDDDDSGDDDNADSYDDDGDIQEEQEYLVETDEELSDEDDI